MRGPFDFIALGSNNVKDDSEDSRPPQGLHHIGPVPAEVVSNLRFRSQVQRLYALGSRAVGELLAELGAEFGITTIIDRKFDRYAGLDPEAIEATGGDGFWPAPLREVRP